MDHKLQQLLMERGLRRFECGPARTPRVGRSQRPVRFPRFWKWLFFTGFWGGIATLLLLLILFLQLPPIDDMLSQQRKPSITFVDRHGEKIDSVNDLYSTPVHLSELPPHVWQSIVATEDRNFFNHFGVSIRGIFRAMYHNMMAGRTVQGGSTLTQQVAKNVFLTQRRTMTRKIQELLLSLWLETRFTKEQILTLYLNRISLVSGKYGINVAAEELFGVPAAKLELWQSAVIAAMLKAPTKYNPLRNPDGARKRAILVLKNMMRERYITIDEATTAVQRIKFQQPKKQSMHRYFIDWMMDNLHSHIGKITDDIVVHTTLDLPRQRRAEKALKTSLKDNSSRVKQGAVLAMDMQGGIVVMIGGRDYTNSQFNRATQAKRQIGSAFKPFVYLTAFNKGYTPDDTIYDGPITINNWSPKNYKNKYYGTVTLEDAFAKSMNSVPVRLAKDIGLSPIIKTAKQMGLVTHFRRDMSIVLGSGEATVIDLVTGYAPFANGGFGVSPHGITAIYTEKGDELYKRNTGHRSPLIDESSLGSMERLFSEAITNGTGRRAYFVGARGGKTGTTQDSRDAWFVGFTDDYICGVWVGNDDSSPMPGITGGSIPADIFKKTLQ